MWISLTVAAVGAGALWRLFRQRERCKTTWSSESGWKDLSSRMPQMDQIQEALRTLS